MAATGHTNTDDVKYFSVVLVVVLQAGEDMHEHLYVQTTWTPVYSIYMNLVRDRGS